MKWIFLAAFLFAFCLHAKASIPRSLPIWNAPLEKPVRVRLSQNLKKTHFQGFGLALAGTARSAQGPARLTKLWVERLQGRWKLSFEEAGVARTQWKEGSSLAIEGLDVRTGTQNWPGHLLLQARFDQFDLVGVVPLEEYLVGVLAGEMPLQWPLEALKAQAVAARSYALAMMRERRNLRFDVESSIMDQVFKPAVRGQRSPMIRRAHQAVSQTAGVILLTNAGRVEKSYYHADCGGRTAPAHLVWGVGDKSTVVVDGSCPGHPRSKWSLQLGSEELQNKLKGKWGLSAPIIDIVTEQLRPDERAGWLRLALADGQQKRVSAHLFREAVGYSQLRSTFFSVQKKGDIFEFQGRGWGHGVGLCQWGTRKLAEKGLGAAEILGHYYPLSRLTGAIKGSPAIALKKTEQPQ